ncbi:MAG TPA: CheR family methyltransferase [Magnetospirillaceae bacterium]|nr:CheR family methyltransferase [Magnetospirillaceae bacterium]
MDDQRDKLDLLRSSDFARVAKFIEGTTGIKVPPGKKTMVEGRLRRRARALGCANLGDYCRVIFEQGGFESESVHLIDAVTTNKTDFYREPSHFTYLTQRCLPEATADGAGAGGRPYKVWSAACSIGAEPYTLAMVLADFAATRPAGWEFSILASDISTAVLAKAARAVFPEEMIEPVPLEVRKRYLLRSRDKSRKLIRIGPELRRTVSFLHLNLMDQHYPVAKDFDAIFCRNLLIYFDKPTQEAVVGRLCRHLRPGGYLFLGHAESLAGKEHPLEWLGDAVFRRM